MSLTDAQQEAYEAMFEGREPTPYDRDLFEAILAYHNAKRAATEARARDADDLWAVARSDAAQMVRLSIQRKQYIERGNS